MAVCETYERFKLWRQNAGRKQLCLISAHGAPTGPSFIVPPGVHVFFYVAPGEAFANVTTDVIDVANGHNRPPLQQRRQTAFTNVCPDYELAKFQGYHGSYWGPLQPVRKLGAKMSLVGTDESYGDVQNVADHYDPTNHFGHNPQMDVATIRYRPGKRCTLGEVVRLLAGMGYREVHCAFCR